jgi:peptidoglycan glycosyltransferase
MNGPIRNVAITLFVAFAVLLIDVTYIQAIAGPTYRDDPRNPRVLIGIAGKERGLIVGADGVPLAESEPLEEDRRSFARVYPEESLFAHSVGFTSKLFGDWGLESSYATELRSKRDLTISDLIDAMLGRDLQAQSLELSLHSGLQRVGAEALGNQSGAVVAINPSTGAILAFISSPSFDPNAITGAGAAPTWDTLSARPDEPLKDRASRESYPPGSTFKVITAAAAIEAGVAGPDTNFANPPELELPGSTAVIRNFAGTLCGNGAEVSLREAFRRSCNTVFGQLAMDLGASVLEQQAEAFGFNREIPFEWETLAGAFPDATTFGSDLAALAQTGLGQRDVQATPLLMAMVAAAIANGGEQMEPYMVARIYDAAGNVVEETIPSVWATPISPATADVVAGMMEQVVASGTGTRAAVSGVRVAGKTGTAETEVGPPHAWFIGFAPVENPTIALAIVVEDGGDAGENATGGSVAAPIAQLLFEYWLLNP